MSECDGKGGREGGREGGRAGERVVGGRAGGRAGEQVLCLHVIEGFVPSWESFASQVWKHIYIYIDSGIGLGQQVAARAAYATGVNHGFLYIYLIFYVYVSMYVYVSSNGSKNNAVPAACAGQVLSNSAQSSALNKLFVQPPRLTAVISYWSGAALLFRLCLWLFRPTTPK